MSSAEDMAAEFEKEGGPEFHKGKRTKTERVEHKHAHPEGDSRKIVQNAMNGENNRKEPTSK